MIFSSAKVSYAVSAMFALACNWKIGPLQASEISREQNIPENFLRTILGKLIKKGLVVSTFGSRGGYALARPPSEISISEIIETLAGPIAALHTKTHDKRLLRFWRKRSLAAHEIFNQTLAELIDEVSGGEADADEWEKGNGSKQGAEKPPDQ